MHLKLLDVAVGAVIPHREAVALLHMEGDGSVALLAWHRLLETSRWGHEIDGAVLGDAEVPGEAVEGHPETGIQRGGGEEGLGAGSRILTSWFGGK